MDCACPGTRSLGSEIKAWNLEVVATEKGFKIGWVAQVQESGQEEDAALSVRKGRQQYWSRLGTLTCNVFLSSQKQVLTVALVPQRGYLPLLRVKQSYFLCCCPVQLRITPILTFNTFQRYWMFFLVAHKKNCQLEKGVVRQHIALAKLQWANPAV